MEVKTTWSPKTPAGKDTWMPNTHGGKDTWRPRTHGGQGHMCAITTLISKTLIHV